MGADYRFSADRLERIALMETRHFWFVGRRALQERLLRRYLGNRPCLALDLGCGTGLATRLLMAEGHKVVAMDMRPEGLAAIRRDHPESWVVRADVTRLPLTDSTFDLVLLLDVLEHTDDLSVMDEVRRVLRPGGVAFVSVPAMPWLWSSRDEAAGHRRRYTRRLCRDLMEQAGLQIMELLFYQCLLFPVVLVTRLLGRRSRYSVDLEERPVPVINSLFSAINRVEATLGRVVPWPWGSTLIAVCRKD